ANDHLTREHDRLELLLQVGEAVSSHLALPGLLHAVHDALRRRARQRLTALWLPEPDGLHLRASALEQDADPGPSPVPGQGDRGALARPAPSSPATDGLLVPLAGSPEGEAFRTGRTVLVRGQGSGSLLLTPDPCLLTPEACALPLRCGDATVGVLSLTGQAPDTFPDDVVALLEPPARPVAVAVANALAYRRIEQLTARLAQEKLYLEEEIRTERRFDEIVGDSPPLREVLRQVEVVAPTDSAVLIT